MKALFTAVKSPSVKVLKIVRNYKDLQAHSPDYIKTVIDTPCTLNLKRLSKMEMWEKYKEYLSELELNNWFG